MQGKCALKNKLVKKQVFLYGQAYTIVMLPNPKFGADEPVMIFLTTLPNSAQAAELYAKRWKIECLFRHLKTNGYNLEDLNLKDPNKNLLMMAIVTTALHSSRERRVEKQKAYPNAALRGWIGVARSLDFQGRISCIDRKILPIHRILKVRFQVFILKKSCDFQKCPVVWSRYRNSSIPQRLVRVILSL